MFCQGLLLYWSSAKRRSHLKVANEHYLLLWNYEYKGYILQL
jgi:hypothetical protein